MSAPARIIVISDLHLGCNDAISIFHAGDALEKFLRWCAGQAGPIQLVILGDALDYLQLEPWEQADEQTALAKTARIIRTHEGVFAALAAFVEPGGDRSLLWCIGNHDLELAFPSVRAAIEAELGGRPTWRLDNTPEEYELESGAKIRLVHGNDADAFNRVDYARLAAAAANGDVLPAYPFGSKLVARVFNPLKKAGFHHIDLLKPEETVALPLTLSLWPDDTWPLVKKAFPLLAGAQYRNLVDKVYKKLVGSGGGSFKDGPPGPVGSKQAPPAPSSEEEHILEMLLAPVIDDNLDAAEFLNWSVNPTALTIERGDEGSFGLVADIAASLLRGAARRNAVVDPFDPYGPDALSTKSTYVAAEKVVLVVAGHTHLARVHEREGSYYINTGTWADLMRLPPNLSRELIKQDVEQLRAGLKDADASGPTAPWLRPFRRLTFADIEVQGKRWRAHLRQWPDEHPPIVASLP